MRPSLRLVWISLAAVGTAVLVWTMWWLLKTPVNPSDAAAPAAATSPASASATAAIPTLNQQGYWNDPSIDPEVLKRAFPPPPKDLPESARPKPMRLKPSLREWQEIQAKGAVAY